MFLVGFWIILLRFKIRDFGIDFVAVVAVCVEASGLGAVDLFVVCAIE